MALRSGFASTCGNTACVVSTSWRAQRQGGSKRSSRSSAPEGVGVAYFRSSTHEKPNISVLFTSYTAVLMVQLERRTSVSCET